MEFQKIINLLDITSDNKDLPRYVIRNGLKFMKITRKLKEILLLLKKHLLLMIQKLIQMLLILQMIYIW